MSRLSQLQKLLALDENDADLHYMIAQEHAGAGSVEEAVAHFDRCLAIDPGYLYAHYHKARALEAAGRVGDAVMTLRTGQSAARMRGDAKALGEIDAYLDSLEG